LQVLVYLVVLIGGFGLSKLSGAQTRAQPRVAVAE
jgi:hypothetical protein